MSDLDHIVDVLTGEFEWDDVTITAFRSSVDRALVNHAGRIEFICDSPVSANWRLKRNADGAWRMAYYGDNPDRQARADEITRRLTDA